MCKAFSFSEGGVEGSAGNRGVFRDATALHAQKKTSFTTELNYVSGRSQSVRLWSPDSLWVVLSHGPHQSTAPVVTHQGDLRDRLEKSLHETHLKVPQRCGLSVCRFSLLCDIRKNRVITILSRNVIKSWEKGEKHVLWHELCSEIISTTKMTGFINMQTPLR